MCGDAGNPQIPVFVREGRACTSHYNTALQQEIATRSVNSVPNHPVRMKENAEFPVQDVGSTAKFLQSL